MVDIRSKKYGFSLAEALVSMLIMSIFFIVTSKVLTYKPKQELQMNVHGYFECYIEDKNGPLKQKTAYGDYKSSVEEVDTCQFAVPTGIAVVVMYALLPHPNGKVLPNGEEGKGKFYVSKEVQFNGNDNNYSEMATISRSELEKFNETMDLDDIGKEGNDNIESLKKFFENSYKTSSIYDILKENSNYAGPALFICW